MSYINDWQLDQPIIIIIIIGLQDLYSTIESEDTEAPIMVSYSVSIITIYAYLARLRRFEDWTILGLRC